MLQQSGTDDAGNDVSGLAAIAQKKANAEADAGLVTEERATEAIRAYQTFFDSDGQIDEDVYKRQVLDACLEQLLGKRRAAPVYPRRSHDDQSVHPCPRSFTASLLIPSRPGTARAYPASPAPARASSCRALRLR